MSLKNKLKNSDNPIAQKLFRIGKAIMYFNGPNMLWLYRVVWHIHQNIKTIWHELVRIFYYTPMFKSQLKQIPKQLLLYGGPFDQHGPEGTEIAGWTDFEKAYTNRSH